WWVQHKIRQRQRWAEVGQVTTHALAGFPGCRVASAPESGEDLSTDRVVPIAERAPHSHGAGAERSSSQHLVVRAEEDQGVLGIGEDAKPRITVEVTAGPLPDVADELVHAKW